MKPPQVLQRYFVFPSICYGPLDSWLPYVSSVMHSRKYDSVKVIW